jgi:hypothetical protein
MRYACEFHSLKSFAAGCGAKILAAVASRAWNGLQAAPPPHNLPPDATMRSAMRQVKGLHSESRWNAG